MDAISENNASCLQDIHQDLEDLEDSVRAMARKTKKKDKKSTKKSPKVGRSFFSDEAIDDSEDEGND